MITEIIYEIYEIYDNGEIPGNPSKSLIILIWKKSGANDFALYGTICHITQRIIKIITDTAPSKNKPEIR